MRRRVYTLYLLNHRQHTHSTLRSHIVISHMYVTFECDILLCREMLVFHHWLTLLLILQPNLCECAFFGDLSTKTVYCSWLVNIRAWIWWAFNRCHCGCHMYKVSNVDDFWWVFCLFPMRCMFFFYTFLYAYTHTHTRTNTRGSWLHFLFLES